MDMNPADIRSMEFVDVLNRLHIGYALIGGMALAAWSEQRFTKDIDFTVTLDAKKWEALQAFLKNSPDVTINKLAYDPQASNVVPYLVRIKYKEELVDLISSLTPYQESLLARRVEVDILGERIFVASPEDIIVTKLIAKRTQDIADIEKLLRSINNLDLAYIQKWAREWEVLDLWNKLFAASGS